MESTHKHTHTHTNIHKEMSKGKVCSLFFIQVFQWLFQYKGKVCLFLFNAYKHISGYFNYPGCFNAVNSSASLKLTAISVCYSTKTLNPVTV